MSLLRTAATAAAWMLLVVLVAWLVAGFALGSPARAWDLRKLNSSVDQTSYMVNEGCSGTLVSLEKRHILTAEHCVSKLTTFIEEEEIQPDGTVKKVKRYYRKPLEVAQSVRDEDGNITGTVRYRARIVGTKAKHDLALIEVIGPVASTMAAPILPDGVRIERGETAYIVGNPYGLEATVTRGIVSHFKRELPGASGYENDVKFTQVDGGASPGNSGGGVFNDDGELIGVLVRGYPSAGHLSFAVDIDDIRAFLASPAPVAATDGAHP